MKSLWPASFVTSLILMMITVTGAAAHATDDAKSDLPAETADLSLEVPDRETPLDIRVTYPKGTGPFPIIVFSHGFGADKTAFGEVAKGWAKHGYITIHPSHLDGFGKSRRPAGNALGANRPGLGALRKPAGDDDAKDDNTKNDTDTSKADRRQRIRALLQQRKAASDKKDEAGKAAPMSRLADRIEDGDMIKGRVRDMVFVLDHLNDIAAKVPALAGKMDPQRIGVGGHSMGAYTAMLLGGVTVDLGKEKNRSFRDPRVRCILPISAQGVGQQGLTTSSWKPLTQMPMLTITGTRDRGASGQGLSFKKQPFELSPPGDKYLVIIEGANHVSFGGGLGERNSGIPNTVKTTSLAFWDAYLKNDPHAKTQLKTNRMDPVGQPLTPFELLTK